MKILLAIDGSPCTELAVEEVARRPWPVGTAVRVLTVIEPAVVAVQEAVVLPQSFYDELEALAQEDLDRAVVGSVFHAAGVRAVKDHLHIDPYFYNRPAR